uniref:Uncharacterized protein n=1 Tax=Meloidogyne enterolobii TaxID=390850 RepID=A0A6V7V7F5_MELEN|nr:unnamed protein product [Meloidogyne enterolobii]
MDTLEVDPAPPPYNVGTTTTATTRTTGGCNNGAREGCNCVSASELEMALELFRKYKRALGITSFVMLMYLFELAVFGYDCKCPPDHLFGFFIAGCMCLLALLGCLRQKAWMLLPMFLIHITSFVIFSVAFVLSIFCMFNTAYWDKALDKLPLLQQVTTDLLSGFSKREALLVFMVFSLLCIITSSAMIINMWTLQDRMPKYCSDLHRIALSMYGSKTDLKNPALVKHMRMHVLARSRKMSRAIVV